ncbi:MAG: FMN-binding glutamate synthase family protein [Myxococcota bacterium]
MTLLAVAAAGLLGLVVYDLVQRRHAILRNFPIIGHFRYWLESIGPELRQYLVTSNDEERPFSRDQRRWVYASSKREKNYFGFGTDNDLESRPNYLIIKHETLGLQGADTPAHRAAADARLPCAKVLGEPRGRTHAFRPESLVNLSGMSFGSLSGPAVRALNRGAALGGFLHNAGEGGLSPHHRHGGDLIFQIGTGYFGCRDASGRFELDLLKEVVAANPVRAIEIKLSQGAKPGVGGFLPGAKVTREIAAARGIPLGRDCASPATHETFRGVDELLDFVERIAEATGLPVGIKSAVGELDFWRELAGLMESKERGVDFVTIDGGEGGTGAGPLVFTDHVALPFKLAMSRVYRCFAERELQNELAFIGSGKLGFPETALLALALGCDLVNVGREAMLALGCLQAQRCHTGRCPTGITTHNRWLVRGLAADLKSVRVASYVSTLRFELLRLAHACGQVHPALVPLDRLEILDGRYDGTAAPEIFGYEPGWGLPSSDACAEVERLMEATGAPH